MNFDGKVAVITGAASGIGLAMAHRFAQAGMHIVMTDIEPDTLDDAAHAVSGHGTSVEAVVCDVRSEDAVAQAVKHAVALGGLHIMCNNAGVSSGGPMWEISEADWTWNVEVNQMAVARGIRHAVPVMIEQGEGHVINTSSMAGITSMPSTGAYTASKHAVVAMSEVLHHELALAGHSNIGVSVLCPGWVATNLMESDRNRPGGKRPEADPATVSPEQAAFREALLSAFHAGKQPAEIADMVHDAVMERRFWIITHDDWFPVAVGRAQDVIDQRNPETRFWPM
jgi:NAD(P)-dependent dehydrogenase (short-subunit alcohol dehydrogenase family)